MISRLGTVLALACLAVILIASEAPAFYTWVDDNGQLHVADYPKPKKPEQEAASEAGQEQKAADALKPGPVTTVQPATSAEKPVPSVASSVPKGEPKTAPSGSLQQALKAVSSPTVTPLTMATVSAPVRVPITPQAAPAPRMVQPAPTTGTDVAAAALLAGLGSLLLLFVFLVYLYFCLCLYLIAKKLNLSGTWMAWVPILQVFTFIACAGKSAWWAFLLLVPIVNFFVTIYLWMCIAENLGKEKWFALLTLVPVVNLIYMGVLAFSKGGGETSPAVA